MTGIRNGVLIIRLASWKDYHGFINNRLRNPHTYVFRGQRRSPWKLESSLDRAASWVTPPVSPMRHYEQFCNSILGRRGANPQELNEDEVWALGQHHGLWTPLLDWTEAPFVALYFAFVEKNKEDRGTRAVYALSREYVVERSAVISKMHAPSPSSPNIVEFIVPKSDENSRLLNQRGLFTRSTPGIDVGTWVRQQFQGETRKAVLVKMVIPESGTDRCDVLRSLSRMNINHLSLFPDLRGSAQYCNLRLAIPGY
jgi:hypothetical protein